MNNELVKLLKIKVDSKEFDNWLKNLKDLNKVQKEIEDRTKKYYEEVRRINKETLDAEAKKLAKEKARIDYNKDLIKLKEKQLQFERRKALLEIDRARKEEENTRAEKQRLKELDELSKERRYKGQGFDEFLLDPRQTLRNFPLARLQKKGQAISNTMAQDLLSEQNQLAELETRRAGIVYDMKSKKFRENGKFISKANVAELDESIENKKSSIQDKEKAKAKAEGDYLTNLNKTNIKLKLALDVVDAMSKATKLLLKPFVDLAKGATEVVMQFIDLKQGIATYATSTSLITNTAAREQMMKYGLSNSQNFAFTQAKSLLNIQSDEDLMFMNSKQRERFLSYMERYSQWYDEMESSGVLENIQEMQLEFNELKQELGMEFLSWVAENKDTIMYCIRGLFDLVKSIAQFVENIMSKIAGANSSNLSALSTSNNSYSSSSKSVVIYANTTNNNTIHGDAKSLYETSIKETIEKSAKEALSVLI